MIYLLDFEHNILYCMQGHSYVLKQVAMKGKLKGSAMANATKTRVAEYSPLKSRGGKGKKIKKNTIHPKWKNNKIHPK